MSEYPIDSAEAMISLGQNIGKTIEAGTVLALCGPLGAGKTHFTKGLVEGLGGDPSGVTSPTFALIHEYRSAEARLPVVHLDFYRMDDIDEVLRIGWEEYLDENDGVIVVEWPTKFPELLPPPPETEWWEIELVEGVPESRIVRRNLGDIPEQAG